MLKEGRPCFLMNLLLHLQRMMMMMKLHRYLLLLLQLVVGKATSRGIIYHQRSLIGMVGSHGMRNHLVGVENLLGKFHQSRRYGMNRHRYLNLGRSRTGHHQRIGIQVGCGVYPLAVVASLESLGRLKG